MSRDFLLKNKSRLASRGSTKRSRCLTGTFILVILPDSHYIFVEMFAPYCQQIGCNSNANARQQKYKQCIDKIIAKAYVIKIKIVHDKISCKEQGY